MRATSNQRGVRGVEADRDSVKLMLGCTSPATAFYLTPSLSPLAVLYIHANTCGKLAGQIFISASRH